MTEEQWEKLPPSITVRELRYRIRVPGVRTREVTLVTTLLDSECYPAKELARLYALRWGLEVNLKHLKQTMKMDVLHCQTVAGVLKEYAEVLRKLNHAAQAAKLEARAKLIESVPPPK